mgnify:CR=1 FL=1
MVKKIIRTILLGIQASALPLLSTVFIWNLISNERRSNFSLILSQHLGLPFSGEILPLVIILYVLIVAFPFFVGLSFSIGIERRRNMRYVWGFTLLSLLILLGAVFLWGDEAIFTLVLGVPAIASLFITSILFSYITRFEEQRQYFIIHLVLGFLIILNVLQAFGFLRFHLAG